MIIGSVSENKDTEKRISVTPEKCLDISLAKKYGWKPQSDLHKGFETTFRDYQKNY